MLLAHAVEGPAEPGLEVPKDPGRTQGRISLEASGSLDPPIVTDAEARQAPMVLEAVGHL